MEKNNVEETTVAYQKPAICTYTESELLNAMEAWGASSSGLPSY
jgi:hypothetical protein